MKLDQILQSIVKKQGLYASYDLSLIEAARKGLEIFNKYYLAMKSNDMYWIACVLDPRIKTNWLKKNHPDAQEILVRIKKFMKEAYLPEEQLPERIARPRICRVIKNCTRRSADVGRKGVVT